MPVSDAALLTAAASLKQLLHEGLILTLQTNFADGRRVDDLPEVTVTIAQGTDLVLALEQIDQAIRPLGPAMVNWEWAEREDQQ